MKYDGRKLIAPGLHEIVAVWDYTSKCGSTGKHRWLCKAANGSLYLYWCLDADGSLQGKWLSVSDNGWWRDLTKNNPPVWIGYKMLKLKVEKCVCDLHQLMRGDGHDVGCSDN